MNYRLQSIDVLQGAVMALMAIDHVRVYSGLPAGGPEPGIFFTRWIDLVLLYLLKKNGYEKQGVYI